MHQSQLQASQKPPTYSPHHSPWRLHASAVLHVSSAMSIQAGQSQHTFDNDIVRDANGLPTIPGTSIAGVLRHLVAHEHGEKLADNIFGFEQKDNRQPSALQVSFGYLHNRSGEPIHSLLDPQAIEDDPLLQQLSGENPVSRDHVRIDRYGVASDEGKYAHILLPAGCEFRVEFELRALTQATLHSQWAIIHSALSSPLFRLGSKTRVGAGNIQVHALHCHQFDLSDKSSAVSLYQCRAGFLQPKRVQLDTFAFTSTPADSQPNISLRVDALRAEQGLRIGDGKHTLSSKDNKHTKANAAFCYSENVWNSKKQCFERYAVIPGSSIKGLLVHRSEYYLRCLRNGFAENEAIADDNEFYAGFNEPAGEYDNPLFGSSTEAMHTDPASAFASALTIDDAYIPQTSLNTYQRTHNAIDRFTGGTRQGVLYTEELLWQPEFPFHLQINRQHLAFLLKTHALNAQHLNAFYLALDDLFSGQLAVGAAEAKGHGYLTHNTTALSALTDFKNTLDGALSAAHAQQETL